ncbi:MAG TPA: dihydroorotase [Candidatus Avacidaminococcus intestinavium]|uniref:Dihydroorotase n=1 Tax=Candidatus Avacidaminococcus intestinavium TaxID=2840684 RepID=A0A9D1SLC3_9FIRM|nr:dihydroorotase [Candidatus Avacidaminococcus intestinavium]
MKILIKNGRIVDPSQNLDSVQDLLIEDGKVKAIAKNIMVNVDEVYDAQGLIVAPGLVDVHTHLREPGLEAKEDIVSGTQAAAAGGVTTIACMPNTKPVIDNSIIVSGIKERAKREGYVNVEIIGAITKGQEGKELAELGDMTEKGAMAFSDDGHYVKNTRLFALAGKYITAFDKVLISHSIDPELGSEGFMHEGAISARMGVAGVPAIAEDIAVARDVLIAEYTGARVHIAHVASKGAVEIIRQAKKRGLPVTCEVTVHHLTLTDEACLSYNTATRVSPPLRSSEHVEAMRTALKDGTIDAIVTDHAPHAPEEKDVEFRYAPCGFCGLETSIGVIFTELYHTNLFTISEIIGKMSTEPANIFSLNAGSLKEGKPADIVIIDPNKEWVVDNMKFYTRGKVTPFNGKALKGKAVATLVAGKFVMRDGVVCVK